MSENLSESFRNYRVYCDICGMMYLASETKMNWRNQRVCFEDYETRSPQENLKVGVDRQIRENMRPRIEMPHIDTAELMKQKLGR